MLTGIHGLGPIPIIPEALVGQRQPKDHDARLVICEGSFKLWHERVYILPGFSHVCEAEPISGAQSCSEKLGATPAFLGVGVFVASPCGYAASHNNHFARIDSRQYPTRSLGFLQPSGQPRCVELRGPACERGQHNGCQLATPT